jgi:hypothetical protein
MNVVNFAISIPLAFMCGISITLIYPMIFSRFEKF